MIRKGLRLAVACLLASWFGYAEELSLEQAVHYALEHNRALERDRLESRKIAERVAALRTRRYPAMGIYALGSQLLTPISFTLSQGLLGVYPAAGPIPAVDVPVQTGRIFTGFFTGRVVQPLSGLYKVRENLRLLDITNEIASEQLRLQQQNITRDVKKLFYGIQQAEGALLALKETVGLYKELGRLTSQYASQGAVLRGDEIAIELNLAKTEQTELTVGSQQATARKQLNLLMGRDVMTEFSVPAIPAVAEFDATLADAVERARRNRPEVRQAQLRTKLAEQDVRAKKSELIPDINAEYNSIGFANFNQFLPAHISTVGVSLTWDIFDWGRKKHEIQEKQYTVEQARSGAAETESAISIEVDDKLRHLRMSRARLRVASLSHDAAVENVRVVANKFKVEAALMKDVLQSQAALQQANAEQEQARAEFWSARAEFERATGDIQ